MLLKRGDFLKNFPVFTTSSGVASLTLEEVPYSQSAYIRLQACLDPIGLLEECTAFCLAVGATKVFATGHDILGCYPVYTDLLKMTAPRDCIGDTDACLFPMQEKTMEQWRQIYNDKMKTVPLYAYMTSEKAKEILQQGSGYFVHQNGELLGIGVVSGSGIDAIVAVKPGAGTAVFQALCHAVDSAQVCVEVASENKPAMALYQRLGFVPVEQIARWYQIK